ncbi:hypothetical protein [Xylanimonas allomyrinae]|uniref:hypothetical protein n=1 Tax=Xylanimonas allomyrinae TaxID=2509459 RepID=UPI0013A66932|nr:hypothetical protein [Xylanimonas allomyrinae]
MNNAYAAAGDVTLELTAHQVDAEADATAGGLWTIPGTSTIGRFCTLSWECQGIACG